MSDLYNNIVTNGRAFVLALVFIATMSGAYWVAVLASLVLGLAWVADQCHSRPILRGYLGFAIVGLTAGSWGALAVLLVIP